MRQKAARASSRRLPGGHRAPRAEHKSSLVFGGKRASSRPRAPSFQMLERGPPRAAEGAVTRPCKAAHV